MSRYSVEVANDAGFCFLNKYAAVPWSPWTKSIVQKLDGEIVAAVVLQDFNGHNLWMHVAADTTKRWITRDLIYWTFHFPFIQLGATRLTGWVEETNKAAIRFDEHVGFRREAVLASAGQHGEDVFLYTMHRHECRWLGLKNGCEKQV